MEATTIRRAGYSIPDTAHQLSISPASVQRLIASGELRRVKIGRRSIVPASEIDRLLEEGAELGGDDAA